MWTDNTQRWMQEIAPYNESHRMTPARGKTCLLVIDMQNEFLEEDGTIFFHYAAEIVPNVKRLQTACRKASIPVIFTGHVHEDPAVDGGMTAVWWPEIKAGRCLIKGSPGAEIYARLRPEEGEKVNWKHRYSAFYNTDLEVVLRGLGVTDLLITGVLTNVCCESTARDAFFRDFRVFFLADATASSEPEYHLGTLKNMAYAFAYVTTVDEVIERIT
jgi:ureidoacrylate peracid hydrolase